MNRKVMCLPLFLAAGNAFGQWSDNFDRPDGAMGPDWTVVSGTWAIESNRGRHTGSGVNTILQHNSANIQYDLSVTTIDVHRIAGNTANAFVGVLIGLGGANPIMVKIQAQAGTINYSNIGIYRLSGATWGAWTGGLPFGALTAPFEAARMTVSFPDANTLKCELDTNFDGVPDQTYTSGNVTSLSLGTQHGITGWLPNANFDNWSVGTPGPTGACCLTSGPSNCIISTATNCSAQGGTYQGDGSSCATANCAPLPTGACCKSDGTCEVLTQHGCTTGGGTYAGNNVTCIAANCPPAGACCFFSTCSTLTSAACTAQGGTWLGSGSACGSCPVPYAETGDAGDLPGTAQSVNGSGPLVGITGALTTGDADMFKINVCNAAGFSASTATLTVFDTQLFIFRPNGTGVTFNDDNPAPATGTTSTIGSSIIGAAGNGEYYLAISQYDKDPLGATTSGEIWLDTPFNVERAPDGPAAAEPIGSWNATTGLGGTYGIRLSGACYLSAGGCYANCDGSTGNPLLTANDFQCFLNKYASNDTYANCDGSTGNPLLTANDFQCFLNKYAGGCS